MANVLYAEGLTDTDGTIKKAMANIFAQGVELDQESTCYHSIRTARTQKHGS